MRSSSCGKRARLESEPHTQKEYVTEVDKARRSMSNLRSPITSGTPTVANEVSRRAGIKLLFSSCPATRGKICESSVTGPMKSLQFHWLVSSVVRHVKGSERSLRQPIYCYASNAGIGCDSLLGRRAGRQCHSRGSESVVVGGVTSTQGERQIRSQGEGTQT
jgi:hypothetical protein